MGAVYAIAGAFLWVTVGVVVTGVLVAMVEGFATQAPDWHQLSPAIVVFAILLWPVPLIWTAGRVTAGWLTDRVGTLADRIKYRRGRRARP